MKATADDWRMAHAVLVPEAGAIGQIAVIRSLGRAGYRVHACASDPKALGLRSRYAERSTLQPPYDSPHFLAWLRDYIAAEGIAAIVPSEAFLLAVRPDFESLVPLMPVNQDEACVYRAFGKCDVLDAFGDGPANSGLLAHLPPFITVRDGDEVPNRGALESLGLPIFLKTDAVHSRSGWQSGVVRALSIDEAIAAITRLRESHSAVLVQGFVPGKRMVADFCVWNDKIISRSMMTARHENPHHGGISTLRSVFWDQKVWDDAARKLHHLGWNGCAMMEYRHDPETGSFHFIEMNARYWTGLNVELLSGADIPRVQMDAFFGRPQEAPAEPTKQVWCRYTVPGEVGYVASVLKDDSLSARRKLWSVLEFFLLTFNPRIKSDLNFPGDRSLYFIAWADFIKKMFLPQSFGRESHGLAQRSQSTHLEG